MFSQGLQKILYVLRFPAVLLVGVAVGLSLSQLLSFFAYHEITSPWVTSQFEPEKPLQKYALSQLSHTKLQPTTITANQLLEDAPQYTRYIFHYTTTGQQISGLLTVPKQPAPQHAVIVMVRGYIPQEGYRSGDGTRNASAMYAQAGFTTIAPDFLGFGSSDPDRSDVLLGRFEKPVQVMELITALRASGITIETEEVDTQIEPFQRIGLWGHSNGGQITIATLEGWSQSIPAVLWAPVTAPFPYSILFFSDTDPDEGKETRKFIASFEQIYDVFDFSITRHVDQLVGPIQLHHGSADADALKVWSDRFVAQVTAENNTRDQTAKAATSAAQFELQPPIEFTYYQYPGADHNLRPDWNTVVDRDIAFFTKELLQ